MSSDNSAKRKRVSQACKPCGTRKVKVCHKHNYRYHDDKFTSLVLTSSISAMERLQDVIDVNGITSNVSTRFQGVILGRSTSHLRGMIAN